MTSVCCRLGAGSARAPVACLVAKLARHALSKSLRELMVLDLTYGYGLFYLAERPRFIIAFDPNVETVLEWRVAPDLYIPQPAWKWKLILELGIRPDLIVVDPPWTRQPNSRRRIYGWILGTERLILEAAAQASRHYNAPLLVHYETRWVPDGFTVLAELWFRAIYRARNRDRATWFGVLKPV